MDEIKAMDRELKRLHKTMQILIDDPDRILGDLSHSDIHASMTKIHDLLMLISKKRNGLEY